MKILQVTAPREFEILEVPIPAPGPGEALLRVNAVATCPQWDLHLAHHEPMFVGHRFHYPYTPGQPGHEATGEIAAVGAGVTGWKVGDRASLWRDAGHDVQGCYAQFVVRTIDQFIAVPADRLVEAVASVELAMCVASCFTMLKEMKALPCPVFGVGGLGPAGLIALQMAKAEGAQEVIGFDLSAERRALGMSLGLSAAFHPDEAELPVRPQGPAIDCSIDCVGACRSVEFLMDRTRDCLALFGVQREDYTYSPRHYNGLRLCGYRGHSRLNAEYAMNLIRKGLLDLAPLVTHRLPLERYGEGIGLLESQEAIKILFLPWVSE